MKTGRMQNFTIEYLTNNRLFECLVNSIVLNNRLMRLSREFDALGFDFNFLNNLGAKKSASCEKEKKEIKKREGKKYSKMTAPLRNEDLYVTINLEKGKESSKKILDKISNPEKLNKKEINCSCVVTSECNKKLKYNPHEKFRHLNNKKFNNFTKSNICPVLNNGNILNKRIYKCKKMTEKSGKPPKNVYLKTIVRKLCFVDSNNSTSSKIVRVSSLSLPCKKKHLIYQVFRADPLLSESCLIMIKKKFEKDVFNVCSCLNNVLNKLEKSEMSNLRLYCDIRASYIKFRLRPIKKKGGKNFFVARVPICQNVQKYICGQNSRIDRPRCSFEEEKWKWGLENMKREPEERGRWTKSLYSPCSNVEFNLREEHAEIPKLERTEQEEKEKEEDVLEEEKEEEEEEKEGECTCSINEVNKRSSEKINETIEINGTLEETIGCDSECTCDQNLKTINTDVPECPIEPTEEVVSKEASPLFVSMDISPAQQAHVALVNDNKEQIPELISENTVDSSIVESSKINDKRNITKQILSDLLEDKMEELSEDDVCDSRRCLLSCRSKISVDCGSDVKEIFVELSSERDSSSKVSSVRTCTESHEVYIKSKICYSRVSSTSTKSAESFTKNSESSQISTNTLSSPCDIISSDIPTEKESRKSRNKYKPIRSRNRTSRTGDSEFSCKRFSEKFYARKFQMNSTSSTNMNSRKCSPENARHKMNYVGRMKMDKKYDKKRNIRNEKCGSKKSEMFRDICDSYRDKCGGKIRDCENFPKFGRRRISVSKTKYQNFPIEENNFARIRRNPLSNYYGKQFDSVVTNRWRKQSSTSISTVYYKRQNCRCDRRQFSISQYKSRRRNPFASKNFRDSFSYRSVNRIKHLIRRKLRGILVDNRDKATNTSKALLKNDKNSIDRSKEKIGRPFDPCTNRSSTCCRICRKPLKSSDIFRSNKKYSKKSVQRNACRKIYNPDFIAGNNYFLNNFDNFSTTSENISEDFCCKKIAAQKWRSRKDQGDKLKLRRFRNKQLNPYYCHRSSSSINFPKNSSRSLDIFYFDDENNFPIANETRKKSPEGLRRSSERILRTCCENNPGNWKNNEKAFLSLRKNDGRESVESRSVLEGFLNEGKNVLATSNSEIKCLDLDQMLILRPNNSSPISITFLLGKDHDLSTIENDQDTRDLDTDFRYESQYVPLCECVKRMLRKELGLDQICPTSNTSISLADK